MYTWFLLLLLRNALLLLSVTPHITAHSVTDDNEIKQRNKKKIVGKFSKLLNKVRRKMKEKPISEDFRFLMNSYFLKEYISKSSDVNETFDTVNRLKLWDYWNYEVIANIVQEFAADDPELTSMMEAYKQDLESYKVTEKLIDHIAAFSLIPEEEDELKQAERYDQHYYKTLSMKLRMRFTDHSLKYIDDLWKEFATLYSLPPRVALLDRVHKGCVSIVWLVPSHLTPQILDAIPLSGDFYHKHDITGAEFDGICIYHESQGN